MVQKRLNTAYWEENKWLLDCYLCYSESKGLYTLRNTLSSDVIYQAHGYKGFHCDTVEKNDIKIRFNSNFGYGSRAYLCATVEKNGQRVLDFDTSKLYILNDCSVATFNVKPYEWNTLFYKIVMASNNFNPELCSTQSIVYIERLREILNSDSVQIKESFTKEKEVVWEGDFIVTLLVSDKTKDLINGLKLAHITDKVTIEYTLKLCKELLAKFHVIDANIADSRTKRMSDTLFLIHEFMVENDCGLEFFSSFVGVKENNVDMRT